MERAVLVSDKKKDRPWDGRSRISTKQYRKNYNEIFKKEKTVLVSLWTNYVYRCMSCGQDLKQKINGKIIYVPYIKDPKTFRGDMEMDITNG